MKPLPISTSSRFAAASSSRAPAAQPPALPELHRLPPRLEIPVDLASHIECKPFVSGTWLSKEAANLDAHDQRLLARLLELFQPGQLPDLNQPPLDRLPGEVRLSFGSDGPESCEAVCMLNEQAEVHRLAIRAPNRTGELILPRPEEEAKSATSAKCTRLQHQLQQEFTRQRLVDEGFSAEKVDKIAMIVGGKKTLQAMITHTPDLFKSGFSHEQIVKIASNNGAAQALPVVLTHAPELFKNDFSHEQIVKIASNNGAARALPAVLTHAPELFKSGFSHEQIFKIASNNGAAQALPAVLTHAPELFKSGFSHEQIVKIASNIGAAQALPIVLKHAPELLNSGFSHEQIFKIASNNGAAQALPAVLTHAPDLFKSGFSHEQIVKIASNIGAAQALPAVRKHAPDLFKSGFSHEQIVKIVASNHGAKNILEAILRLSWKGILDNAELIQVVTGKNKGASALEWFLQHWASLEHSMPKPRIIQLAANGNKARKDAALKQAGVEVEPASSRDKRGATAPAAPRQKKVKTEPPTLPPFPSNFPAPARAVEIERLNTVHALHTPVTLYPLIDLTMPQGPDIGVMDLYRVRHANEAALVTGKQTYDPELERVFPIRDPANPAQVHPDYADPDNPKRCARNVSIQEVRLLKSEKRRTKWGSKRPTEMTEEVLWKMLKNHFVNDHRYSNGSENDMKKEFIESLKLACRQELQACLQGENPPSTERVKIGPMSAEQCDSLSEAKALAGQYGGVLKDYAKDQQPSLRNGRIVCLFAGARLETAEERTAYFELLGPELANQAQHDYSAQIRKHGSKKKRVDWAPYGGGNMGQYFNSSFQADGRVDLVVSQFGF